MPTPAPPWPPPQDIVSRQELMGLAQDIVGRFPDLLRGFHEFLDRCESLELDVDVRQLGRVRRGAHFSVD